MVLSFTDSDLSALAAAYRQDDRRQLPSLRLASLQAAPASAVGRPLRREDGGRAKFVLVRCLGGLDYWRYGLERLRDVCREAASKLAVLPGDDRPDRAPGGLLAPCRRSCSRTSTPISGPAASTTCAALLRRIAQEIGVDVRCARTARRAPRLRVVRRRGAADRSRPHWRQLPPDRAARLISSSIARPCCRPTRRPIEAFADAPCGRAALAVLMLAVPSLKDADAESLAAQASSKLRSPDIVVTTTAFSAREDDVASFSTRRIAPSSRSIAASSTREAWLASARGLSASDMTMQIVLPEFDGRIAVGPIAFKEEDAPDPELGFTGRRQSPDPDGIAARRRSGPRLGRPARARHRGAPARAGPLRLSGPRRPRRLRGRARYARRACAGILDCLAEAGYDAATALRCRTA